MGVSQILPLIQWRLLERSGRPASIITRHNDLRDILVSTGNAILKPHTELDHYWPDGSNDQSESMRLVFNV
jgi:hypothetical protein